MKIKALMLVWILFASFFAQAQNGKIISRTPFEVTKYDTLMARIAVKSEGAWVLKKEYEYLNTVTLEEIFYNVR